MNVWDAFAAHPWWFAVGILAAGWSCARVVVAIGQLVNVARGRKP